MLVIDDDAEVAGVVKQLLGHIGIEAVLIRSAAEVLGRDLSRVGLVLLDWNLAGLDALGIARALRSRGFAGPLIAYSGAEPPPAKLAQADFDGFLSKGSSIHELLDLCRRCVTGDAPADPLPARSGFDRRSADWRAAQRIYVDRLMEAIDRLKEAVENKQYAQIAKVAHRLTGTGALYDLPGISTCSRNLFDEVTRLKSTRDRTTPRAVADLTAASQDGHSAAPAPSNALRTLVDELEVHVVPAAARMRTSGQPR